MREYTVEVEVRCLVRPVHSGQKGGPVPDPVQILCRLVADYIARDGSMRIVAFEAHPILGSANQILPWARARVATRTGTPHAECARLVRRLGRKPPFGARVKARVLVRGPGGSSL